MRPIPIITLTTDFGTADAYVGAMKGVILGIAPAACIVDISHEIAPQAVAAGALVLEDAWRYFPAGTVHVAVVDPGVGTARRAIAVESGDALGVGPDNGVLTPLLAGASRVVELRNERFFRQPVSATFHGRDIFSPVAAHIATGADLDGFGPRVHDAIRLKALVPSAGAGGLVGEIIHVDHFGNLVTSITRANMAAWTGVERPDGVLAMESLGGIEIEFAGQSVAAISPAYGDPGGRVAASSGDGALRALFGSSDRLEIAVPGGSAARATGAGPGTRVTVRRKGMKGQGMSGMTP